MRLGQLARKLSLRPAQIVEFLAVQGIRIEENSNTRMQDNHVMLVVQQYAPESLSSITIEPDEVVNEEPVAEVQTESELPAVPEEVQQPKESVHTPTQEIEVIRVPKIELSGLKVLGKIELAELKIKEAPGEVPVALNDPPSEDVPSVKAEVKPRKRSGKRDHKKPQKANNQSWKNPLEVQREREAKEAEERKKQMIAREKEKRKQYYEEKVKAAAKPKRVKPKDDQSEEVPSTVQKPEPKTLLGKFLRWWVRG
jgi:hypothetical protein